MEIVGYGILLAFGWYIAPFIIMSCVAVVVGTFSFIASIFK